jgi:predicted RNase H-like HicB family nuclease
MNVFAGVASSAATTPPTPHLDELLPYAGAMDRRHEVEFVFAPQQEGGYHVYAPDLPGLHTEGETLEDAAANAREALELYVEALREEGRSLDAGVIRRSFPVPL